MNNSQYGVDYFQLEGMGEDCKLTQWGPEQSHGNLTILRDLLLVKNPI